MTTISIVVADVGDSPALEETLESLRAQDNHALEIVVEQETVLAHALQRGFGRARGEIQAFLRPGESLLPGALQAVRREIDPARGRYVVMGRTALLIEGMDAVLRHPADCRGLTEHLQVWKRGFDDIAYSSLFWHRSATPDLSSLPEGSVEETAFDFSCRLLERSRMHNVDLLWSVASMPMEPPQVPEIELLSQLIAVSRRHWGSLASARRWQCTASYLRYVSGAHERARHHARGAEIARAAGNHGGFLVHYARTVLCEPRMARERLRR